MQKIQILTFLRMPSIWNRDYAFNIALLHFPRILIGIPDANRNLKLQDFFVIKNAAFYLKIIIIKKKKDRKEWLRDLSL